MRLAAYATDLGVHVLRLQFVYSWNLRERERERGREGEREGERERVRPAGKLNYMCIVLCDIQRQQTE